MIEQFKDNEVRNTGIIYSSTFEQIKKLYAMSPEQAGEFAIAAIELVLTGDVSSDDYMIELMLEPTKKLNENNRNKYESKVENARNKKIADMKLDKIAEMANKGMRQREIGEKLGLSQQIISYRMGIIRT
jgi:DNA-binding NarL/FixJ family response regulator